MCGGWAGDSFADPQVQSLDYQGGLGVCSRSQEMVTAGLSALGGSPASSGRDQGSVTQERKQPEVRGRDQGWDSLHFGKMPEELRHMEKLPGLGYQDTVPEYLGKAITSARGQQSPFAMSDSRTSSNSASRKPSRTC